MNARRQRSPTDAPAWAGLATNLTLGGLKVAVGLLGRSQALLADGIHSVADAVGSVAVLVGLAVARRPADSDHPYGHGKAESVAAFIVALLLVAAGVQVAVVSGGRLLHARPQAPPALVALWVAAFSAGLKEAMYRYGHALGLRHRSPALLTSAADHRSDALASAAAFGGILGARLGAPLLDPAAGLFVSLFVIRWGWRMAVGAIADLLDARGEPVTTDRVRAGARAVPGVLAVQAVRTRRMGPHVLVDLEIGVAGETPLRGAHAVAHAVRERLVRSIPEVADVMVHVNPIEPCGRPAARVPAGGSATAAGPAKLGPGAVLDGVGDAADRGAPVGRSSPREAQPPPGRGRTGLRRTRGRTGRWREAGALPRRLR